MPWFPDPPSSTAIHRNLPCPKALGSFKGPEVPLPLLQGTAFPLLGCKAHPQFEWSMVPKEIVFTWQPNEVSQKFQSCSRIYRIYMVLISALPQLDSQLSNCSLGMLSSKQFLIIIQPATIDFFPTQLQGFLRVSWQAGK